MSGVYQLSCPFCGADVATIHTLDQCKTFYGVCPTCGARGPVSAKPVTAIELWNSRPKENGVAVMKDSNADTHVYCCGKCGEVVGNTESTYKPNYCCGCGQRILWPEDEADIRIWEN